MDRLGSQVAVTKCDPEMQDGSLVLSDMRPLIRDIRGVQIMLDRDLAAAYKVSTTAFNQAVKRNVNRFPKTFRFQLTKEEHEVLISQIVTSKRESGKETRFNELFSKFAEEEASLKDAGRLTFSATRMGPEAIPGLLDSLHKAVSETKTYK